MGKTDRCVPHRGCGYVAAIRRKPKAPFATAGSTPGDIGRLQSDGLLIVVGRERALLKLGGDKVSAEVLEEVLMSHAAVAQAAVFTHADNLGIAELWAAVVLRARADPDALRRHCAQKLGGAFAPAHFAMVDSLPRNAAGKLDRSRLPALAAAASARH
jgi:fatty-acyl-CoA synthase